MSLENRSERTGSCDMMSNVIQKIKKNWFLLGVVCVITCAKLYPWIGAKGGKAIINDRKFTAIDRTTQARSNSEICFSYGNFPMQWNVDEN